MRTRLAILLSAVVLGATACSDAGTGPSEPTYASIAGSYGGAMSGLSQGIAMNANFSISIQQTGGTTSGTYALAGVLTDGVDYVDVQGTGTITGSVATGTNPSVNMTIRVGACPAYTAQFSGAYDSVNQRLTVTGPVDFFGANSCTVVLSYPTTIILNR